jgi:hypothetical protein
MDSSEFFGSKFRIIYYCPINSLAVTIEFLALMQLCLAHQYYYFAGCWSRILFIFSKLFREVSFRSGQHLPPKGRAEKYSVRTDCLFLMVKK